MAAANPASVEKTCHDIFAWGGLSVASPRRPTRETLQFVRARPQLIADINMAANMLKGQAPALSVASWGALPMDSAITKVYAAAGLGASGTQDVLMFDGRVASGLSYLARRFIQQTFQSPFPSPKDLGLDFMHSIHGRNRNPKATGIRFTPITNGYPRAETAHRAATVIQAALRKNQPSWEFAEFEKALFMIGYDVEELCCGCRK